ncbi:MAG TPA: DUF4159 domain-containing protein [Longimicrobiales bacterium]|nr:DUF4159 domain-containing protein [Longimicrobiales bacterium]
MRTRSILLLAAMTALLGASAPNELTIAQVQYGGGGDWYANPSGLPNLLREIRARTGLRVAERPLQLKITDPNLWTQPYVYITGHGNIRFTEEEVQILRRYLTSGGFLHADDNYGMDESFRRELKRIFPDKELVELPASHPIYHVMYDLPNGLPKVHQHDGKRPQGFGIVHEGRVVVFYSYESDLGNGWEDPGRYQNPPESREAAFRMGVNLFLYAMSQVTS